MKTKKQLITVISFMLAMIFLIPVTAFAENGPAKDSYAAIYLQSFDERYTIYSANQDTDLVEGVVYDEATNTLTLTDIKKPDFSLDTIMMGDDFTLCLVGENALSYISIWGGGWGGSLTITGSGSIVVNESKRFSYAIILSAERTEGKLNIQNGVTAKLYSQDAVSTAIYVEMSSNSDKNNAIIIGGSVAEEYTIYDSKDDCPYYKSAVAYNATSGDDFPAFTKENDSTVYVGFELYDKKILEQSGSFVPNGRFDMYSVKYCKKLGLYLAKPVEGMADIDPTEKGFTAKSSNMENIVLVNPEYQLHYTYYKDKSDNELLVNYDIMGYYKCNLVTIDGYGDFVTRGEKIDYFDELEAVIDGYQPAYYYSINVPTLTITPSSAKYGDCNNDNGINAKDVLILKQHLAKWTVDINMTNADCNGDGAVNAKDLLRLRQYLANWGVPLGRA